MSFIESGRCPFVRKRDLGRVWSVKSPVVDFTSRADPERMDSISYRVCVHALSVLWTVLSDFALPEAHRCGPAFAAGRFGLRSE